MASFERGVSHQGTDGLVPKLDRSKAGLQESGNQTARDGDETAGGNKLCVYQRKPSTTDAQLWALWKQVKDNV